MADAVCERRDTFEAAVRARPAELGGGPFVQHDTETAIIGRSPD